METIESIKKQISAEGAKPKAGTKLDRSSWGNSIVLPSSKGSENANLSNMQKIKKHLLALPKIGPLLKKLAPLRRLNHLSIVLENLEKDQIRLSGSLYSLQLYLEKEFQDKVNTCIHQTNILLGEVGDLRNRVSNVKSVVSEKSNQTTTSSLDTTDLGRFYLAFEDRFRATTESLTEGFECYRPMIDILGTRVKNLPCLDVGCGRGEWLNFVKNLNFSTEGVDSNYAMVEACQTAGHNAHHADGIEYLSQKPADNYGMISAFHVVEHLPLGALLRLIEECFRTLAPGGIAIFETPNPENLFVGACNFYTDPTHRNPIPPQTLDFLVLQKGFKKTQVVRKNKPTIPPLEIKDPGLEYIHSQFSKEQDYAIVAFKL